MSKILNLLLVAIISAILGTIISLIINKLMFGLNFYSLPLTSLFVDALFLNLFIMIPVVIILEKYYLNINYKEKYIHNMTLFSLFSFVIVFILYFVFEFNNSTSVILLLKYSFISGIVTGVIPAIIFYHTYFFIIKKCFRSLSKLLLCIPILFFLFLLQLSNVQPTVVEDYYTFDELLENIPFDLKIPAYLPDGLTFSWSSIYQGDLIQIQYSMNNQPVINYNVSKSDMNKHFNEYSENYQNILINDTLGQITRTVYIDLENKQVEAIHIIWKIDGFHYSLDSSKINEEELIKIAKSVN